MRLQRTLQTCVGALANPAEGTCHMFAYFRTTKAGTSLVVYIGAPCLGKGEVTQHRVQQ